MEIESLARKNILDIQPYKPGRPLEEVQRELGIEQVIKLASNENPLGPSPVTLKAIESVIAGISLYPDGSAHCLKEALAMKLNVSPLNLFVGNGSNEIITIIMETFLNPGEDVIIADPSFAIFPIAVRIGNGRSVLVPLRDFKHDLQAMADAITNRTKLIVISNPNNPTGTYVTRAELEDFWPRVPPKILIVFDEAYYEYVQAEDYPQTISYVREGRHAIILRTFSKIYGLAGLRIGYGIAIPQIINLMNKVRQPFNVNSIAQVAAQFALEDDMHVQSSIKTNNEGKRYLYRELERLRLSYVPTSANFVLINLKCEAAKILERLLRKGIIVRSMEGYKLPHYIRVTVGTQEQNERLIGALEEALA
jgi:histidinol-phosphate aminotransferase